MDRIGAYSWHPGSDRWMWNDTMFHLHGYSVGGVRPSRALVVAHKHPDDRTLVEDVMADAIGHRLAYTNRHRIVSVDGSIHQVVAVGHPAAPDPGWPPGLFLRGWLVHLATWPAHRSAAESTAGAAQSHASAPFPSTLSTPPNLSTPPDLSTPPPMPTPPPLSTPPPLPTPPPGSSARGGPPPPGWSSWASVEHDRHVARAIEVLAAAMELPQDPAGALLAHLANAAAEPLIVVAERVISVSLDPETEGLAGLLAGIAASEP
jgi:hypothetical protein